MSALTGEWERALHEEFSKEYYKNLFFFIRKQYSETIVYPKADEIFTAFHLTPLEKVKVVILGQDPYHNEGQAHGLCFSVKPQVAIPPSLENIYKELHDDLGCKIPSHGCLTSWAKQGVLLLNTVLTVQAHKPMSHRGVGWEEFTDAAIAKLNTQDRPIVFILWGKPAQELRPGDVVNIAPGVKHWHGAAPDSWFSHLALEVPGEETSNEWLEPVDGEGYLKATSRGS